MRAAPSTPRCAPALLAAVSAACAALADCCPSDHDCQTTGAPGCTNTACCEVVCGVDPFCCAIAWDGICVAETSSLCNLALAGACDGDEGEPCGWHLNDGCFDASTGGDCCAVSSGECHDAACAAKVCALLSSCCNDWDSGCAAYAQVLCPACQRPGQAFGAIACGESVCGTVGAAGALPDEDWFAFEIVEAGTSVSLALDRSVIPVFEVRALGDCTAPALIGKASIATCFATIDACLDPGWYAVRVAAADATSCDAGGYVLSMTCSVSGCAPSGCGSPEAGSCFAEHDAPFCDEADCCSSVCAILPQCCTDGWWYDCSDLAACVCDAPPPNDLCENATPVGEGTFGAELCGAESELAITTVCVPEVGPVLFQQDVWFRYLPAGDGIATFSLCGGWTKASRVAVYADGPCGSLGDALVCSGWQACEADDVACVAVEGGRSYLVRVGREGAAPFQLDPPDWEQLRIELSPLCDASPSCPNAHHDCLTGGLPGCSDEACCATVCAIAPFCCELAWSISCIEEARVQCGYPACAVEGPGGMLVEEPEPCGAMLQSGCATEPQSITMALAPGVVVHGSIGASGSAKDIDAFSFEVAKPSEVAFFVHSEAACTIAFSAADCHSFYTFMLAETCQASALSVCLEPGSYLALVQGFEDYPCNGELGTSYWAWLEVEPSCAPPANDECAAALPIGDGPWDFDMLLATRDGPGIGWPCAATEVEGAFGPDVWYAYVAQVNGDVTIDLCASAMSTRLAVYAGTGCDGLEAREIACNVAACGVRSSVSFTAACGEEFLVRVGGYSAGGSMEVSSKGTTCAVLGDIDGNGAVDAADLGLLLAAWGACDGPRGGPCAADLDGDGVVDGVDLGLLLGAWS